VGSNRLVRRQDRTPLPTGELSYMVILANETIKERITGKPGRQGGAVSRFLSDSLEEVSPSQVAPSQKLRH
jgi:hypothetical protein